MVAVCECSVTKKSPCGERALQDQDAGCAEPQGPPRPIVNPAPTLDGPVTSLLSHYRDAACWNKCCT
ncbi:hypothetical protein J6590_036754 [Homalodisca vitripennis]|nr:hypothetical protein J6590_036754 [Homalodisca vitripennis]